MIVGVNQLFQFDIINNIVTFAATWHSKDVLQWDNFSFCLDSLVSCGSLCRKVSLSPSLTHTLSHTNLRVFFGWLLHYWCFCYCYPSRHVFQDGLQNQIETRHSVSLCLLFCPIGILTHVITKALTKSSWSTRHCLQRKLVQKQHNDGFIN